MSHEWKAAEFRVFSAIKEDCSSSDQTVCDTAWPLLK